MVLKDYDSMEEAYQDGYRNGKFVGTLEAVKHVINQIEDAKEEDSK